MNEATGLTNDPRIWAAAIGTAITVGTLIANMTSSLRQARINRRRQAFSDAYRAIVAYSEYPYVLRRRNPEAPADERRRISAELQKIQEDLAFHSAWVQTESRHVASAYKQLVAATRKVAGTLLHDAWLRPGIGADQDMNIPDVDLRSLTAVREAYLTAARDVLSLSPWWVRVGSRLLGSHLRRLTRRYTSTASISKHDPTD